MDAIFARDSGTEGQGKEGKLRISLLLELQLSRSCCQVRIKERIMRMTRMKKMQKMMTTLNRSSKASGYNFLSFIT